MQDHQSLLKPYSNLHKTNIVLILFLTLMHGLSFGQKIRFIDPVFDSITVTNTFYGTNISVLAIPNLTRVRLPVSIFTPRGDTVKSRPLIIYLHTGNFLPYPVNGLPTGRTSTFGDPALSSLAALGMGFPVDSTLIEICTRLTKMGYVVAAIDYRTGWNPVSNDYGERVNTLINAIYRGVQDFRTAIRYFKSTVKSQGNPFGIDTTKIVGWGEGTGGKITLTAAVLDNYTDIVNAAERKFIGGTELMPVPYVIESMHGDIYGTSTGIRPFTGDTLSLPNHVGFGSDFQLCVNLGGGLADTSWLDDSDLPLIAYHETRDPFVPYKDAYILIPPYLPVIFEKGSYLVTQRADKLGLQKQMRDLKLNDICTQHANQKNDGIEGLYPLTGDNPADAAPWNWWDTTVIVSANSKNGLLTNPNMSAEKARRYIDTILCYFAPRAFAVLNLGTSVNTPDFLFDFEVGFKMMPNPMVNQTVLHTDLRYPMKSVVLFDLNGKVMRAIPKINTSYLTLYRNELPQGVYFLQIGFEKGVLVKPLIIQ